MPFISVHAEIFGKMGHSYDMHENNFGMLKNENLPVLDMVYPALISDLEERGLLDSTLVVVMGEMGRSPRVNANAGRDHWPQCGFCLLTGGGVRKAWCSAARMLRRHTRRRTRSPRETSSRRSTTCWESTPT